VSEGSGLLFCGDFRVWVAGSQARRKRASELSRTDNDVARQYAMPNGLRICADIVLYLQDSNSARTRTSSAAEIKVKKVPPNICKKQFTRKSSGGHQAKRRKEGKT
jgi:hypothetical protein